MSKIKKALAKIQTKPTDFTWKELVRIMLHFGYKQLEGDGSRVKFYHEKNDTFLALHKPHNPKTLRTYQIDGAINRLKRDGFI